MAYDDFKNSVLGQVIGDGQCVSLIVNNSNAYAEYLFPGVSWPSIISPIEGARQLLDAANGQYFQAIQNDHNDPNQLPQQGDVLVFDATPQPGYTNQFQNPYGHTGLCEATDSGGYTILHQNSPYEGAPVNTKWYPWNYRPCLGWLRPVLQTPPPAPTPQPEPTPEPVPAPVEPPAPDPAPVTPPVAEPPVEAPVQPQPLPEVTAPTVPVTNSVPVSIPEPQPLPAPVVSKPVSHWYDFILAFLRWLAS